MCVFNNKDTWRTKIQKFKYYLVLHLKSFSWPLPETTETRNLHLSVSIHETSTYVHETCLQTFYFGKDLDADCLCKFLVSTIPKRTKVWKIRKKNIKFGGRHQYCTCVSMFNWMERRIGCVCVWKKGKFTHFPFYDVMYLF